MRTLLALIALSTAVLAAETFPDTSRVMAVLREQCVDCHNDKKDKAGLRLDSRESLLKGSENGIVAQPGKPSESLLIEVLDKEADPHMPPKGQLSDEEIALLAAWVRADLPWDETAMALAPPSRVIPDTLPPSYRPILAAAAHESILAYSRGASIVLMNTASNKWPELHRIEAHHDAVRGLAWSTDGRQLASVSYGRLAVHDREGRDVAVQSNEYWFSRIAARADGWLATTADPDRPGRLVSFGPELKLRNVSELHKDAILDMVLLSSGRVATASADMTVGIWQLPEATLIRRLEGHTAYVRALAVSPDGKWLASGSDDQLLHIWDWEKGLIERSLTGHPESIARMAWQKDGKALFTACADGSMRRFSGDKTTADRTSAKSETGLTALARVGDHWFTGAQAGQWQAWSADATSVEKSELSEGPKQQFSFRADVLPVLSRAGCSTGECHARQDGQKGFQLTVFAFDPKADFRSIVEAAGGRRVFPAAPEHSLLLRKPARLTEHEGGQRFKPGSPAWQVLYDWIADGMAYELPDDPILASISLAQNVKTLKPGESFQLNVTAHFKGGETRDVTDLTAFGGSNPTLVSVTEEGEVTAGPLPAEAAVVARFMGQVAVCRITIPPETLIPPEQFAALKRFNFIDDLALENLAALGLEPSSPCSDEVFIRRASLDIAGRLPPEGYVRNWLADSDKDKRQNLVKQLLQDPNMPNYWSGKWADLLRPNPDRAGIKSVMMFDQWLRQSFRENWPMDRFARELLTAQGNTHRLSPTVVYRDKRTPEDLATVFSRLLLGVRLECARCHHHPNEHWSQTDFFQTAAFFNHLKRKGKGVSPPISGDHETIWFSAGKALLHPVTSAEMNPVPPGSDPIPVEEGADPRLALADWALAPENPLFARAMVNRVWAEFFGRGFVEPVDDFRASNPPVHPALLDALAADFAKHGYDLHHLIRRITSSALYQLSDTPTASNNRDGRNFARALRRRLPAEVLADQVADITEVPHTFEGMRPGARAVDTWNVKIRSDFLDAFGRPDSSEDPPCERDKNTSLVQALHLMHSEGLQNRLEKDGAWVAQLAAAETPSAEVVERIYLRTFARFPSDKERAIALKRLDVPKEERRIAIEDVLWALFNSAEFLYNH